MKILIANPHLKVGGIASSLVNWLHYLKENTNHEVTVVIFDDEIDSKYIESLQGINVIVLNEFKHYRLSHRKFSKYSLGEKLSFLKMIFLRKLGFSNFYLKKIFKKYKFEGSYDIAISYSNDIPKKKDNVLSNDFVLFSVDSKSKVAWVHNDIERLGFTHSNAIKRFNDFDFVVNVAKSCKAQFDELVPEFMNKSLVVSNPVNEKEIEYKVNFESSLKKVVGIFTFVTVARIAKQKRIDRLFAVALKLHKEGRNFRWYVLGGGDELEKFRNLAIEEGIQEKLLFMGFLDNPYQYLKIADYFILTSDYEAQPVAVLEALTLSVPVVTTDIPVMSEFIINGTNGYITNKDEETLFKTLNNIIEHGIHLKGFEFSYNKYETELNTLFDKCTFIH